VAVKSFCKLSGLVALAALLCFLPSAFGQSPANSKVAGAKHAVLTYQLPSLLAFALTSGNALYNNNGKGNKGNNGYGGYGGNGNGGKNPVCAYGEKCAAVPEGGTPLMYLLLAGLSCFGAMVLRSRRQASMPETN
ncbi:MAG: hypothetical protein WBG40_18600, partial [Candidatus Sulfotelmatobacter sp.]